MRDKDFFKFRRSFFRGWRAGHYHHAINWRYPYTKMQPYNFFCKCGWKGNDLYDHFIQLKPQRDIYKPIL